MKAVIMAAGKGTRMMPLTKTVPKVLVNVNGQPFMHYVIENLKKAGFDDFGIIAGYKKEKIEEFIKENKIKAKIIFQEKQLGTGHALMQAKEYCGEDNFVVLGGDNLFSVKDLKQMNSEDNKCYVIGKEDDCPEKYGVLKFKENDDDKLLEKIYEKPKEYVGNLINIGLYKFTPEIWDALDKIEVSERGEYELTDAINILAKEDKVKVLKLKDYWQDLGCVEDIKKVENFIKGNI